MKDNWVKVQLSNLVECLDGQRIPIKKEIRELIKGSIPYYGASGIIDFVNDYIFDEELILLGEDGENVISRNLPLAFKISGKNWVNNHAHVLRAKHGYDTDFLVYLLENKDYTDIVSGSAQPKINQNNLMKLVFNVPESLQKQQKIAKILSTCDEVIEKTEAAIAKYKAIKQGMMQDLFTRGIDVSTGKLRPSYQEAPELYKESELGMIPKEWEVKRLEEIGDIVTGNTPPTSNKDYYDGNIMFISPFDISDSKFITKSEKKITDLGLSVSRQIPINTICVVCIGSTIGKMGMSIELSTTNQQINSITVFSKNLSEFFYYSCKINLPKQLLVEAGLQAVPIVNKSTFEKLLISLPQLQAESIKISYILSSYDEKLQAEESSLSKYKKLKEGLMQDLLTGKVEVSE